jgi:hypothetical protein
MSYSYKIYHISLFQYVLRFVIIFIHYNKRIILLHSLKIVEALLAFVDKVFGAPSLTRKWEKVTNSTF